MKTIIETEEMLQAISESIDISPAVFQQAVDHYTKLGDYLEQCEDGYPSVYVQGSFRLGTVIRPFRNGKDAEFDIDIVADKKCSKGIGAGGLKHDMKRCLESSPVYSRLLSPKEGRRSWRLDYASTGVGDFHIDVLPCVPEEKKVIEEMLRNAETPQLVTFAVEIAHLDKKTGTYSWKHSNPDGYGRWFDSINEQFLEVAIPTQRERFVNNHVYASVAQIPRRAYRSSLQRVIQLLKRHRDCRFAGKAFYDDRPISIIITTLCCQIARDLARSEMSVSEVLDVVVEELKRYRILLEKESYGNSSNDSSRGYIRVKDDGHWNIPNPVDPRENFADRWHENDNAKAIAFFQWIEWLVEDMKLLSKGKESGTSFRSLGLAFGEDVIRKVYRNLELNPVPMAQKIEPISRPYYDQER